MSGRRRGYRRGLWRRNRENRLSLFDSDKPREERSYEELYPDLRVDVPVKVYFQGHGHFDDIVPSAITSRDPNIRLKQPSFRQISSFQSPLYTDHELATVGYQETELFHTPEAYIRSFVSQNDPAIENYDLSVENGNSTSSIRVEYDMDEQDDEFLSHLNHKRTDQLSVPGISKEIFEVIMTLLEMEWYLIERRMPAKIKPPFSDEIVDSEDQNCVVCDDGECDNSNAIVFCDGCDIAIHQDCYGVAFIPEGQWLCRRCMFAPKQRVPCVFCPNVSGAFKQTDTQHWAHLICALWIPEASIANHVYMEPVTGIDRIPKGRWKLTCYICRQKVGACIQCANKSCFLAFHATCARKARLCMIMKNGIQGALNDPSSLLAYCDKHCPSEYQEKVDVQQSLKTAQEYYKNHSVSPASNSDIQSISTISRTSSTPTITIPSRQQLKSSITSKIPKQSWKTPKGTPVVPYIMFNRIFNILQRFNILQCKSCLSDVSRYWVLKRQQRGGAALTKRLQIALEASPNITKLQLDRYEELMRKLSQLKTLSDHVRNREQIKLDLCQIDLDIMDVLYFPAIRLIAPIWNQFLDMDIDQDLTRRTEADFESLELENSTITSKTIQKKVDLRQYTNIQQFEDDISAFCDNCLTYFRIQNMPAMNLTSRIVKALLPLLAHAHDQYNSIKINSETGLPDFAKFDPDGLRVQEEEWEGVKVLREMSPLTDLDEVNVERLRPNQMRKHSKRKKRRFK